MFQSSAGVVSFFVGAILAYAAWVRASRDPKPRKLIGKMASRVDKFDLKVLFVLALLAGMFIAGSGFVVTDAITSKAAGKVAGMLSSPTGGVQTPLTGPDAQATTTTRRR